MHVPSFPCFYSPLVVVYKKLAASAQAPFHPFLWLISPVSMWHRGALSLAVRWNECFFAKMLMPLSGPYQAIIPFFITRISPLKWTYRESLSWSLLGWAWLQKLQFKWEGLGSGIKSWFPIPSEHQSCPSRNRGDKHSLAWWVPFPPRQAWLEMSVGQVWKAFQTKPIRFLPRAARLPRWEGGCAPRCCWNNSGISLEQIP